LGGKKTGTAMIPYESGCV